MLTLLLINASGSTELSIAGCLAKTQQGQVQARTSGMQALQESESQIRLSIEEGAQKEFQQNLNKLVNRPSAITKGKVILANNSSKAWGDSPLGKTESICVYLCESYTTYIPKDQITEDMIADLGEKGFCELSGG